MGQLTLLEKAAGDYLAKYSIDNSILRINAFEAGAKWQKEQLFNLIRLVKDGLPVLLCEGFDELVEQINNELDQLQD